MVELDENGQIPRKDRLTRAYHVAGYTDGKRWHGFNSWSGQAHMVAPIEAYSTFRGWATPEIDGDARSTQPALSRQEATDEHLRFALFKSGHGAYLQLWSKGQYSQEELERLPDFIAWVTDTLVAVAALPDPPQDLSTSLEVIAGQFTPLTQEQRELLKKAAQLLRTA